MSTAYENSGRTRQKNRTRSELISAARRLIEQGAPSPSVEEAAAEAGISRTTAYRYFGNQRALLMSAHPEIDQRSLLTADSPNDPEARFLSAVDAFISLVIDTEPQLRTMLRLSLEESSVAPALPLRQGRAVGWFEDALGGLGARLSDEGMRRLVQAVRSAIGIESLVWLTDVAGLSRAQAAELMRWTARALLNAALTDGPPVVSPPITARSEQ